MKSLVSFLLLLEAVSAFLVVPSTTTSAKGYSLSQTRSHYFLPHHHVSQFREQRLSIQLSSSTNGNDVDFEGALKMKEEAAELRRQAIALEQEVENMAKTAALKSFAEFDSNKDGVVSLIELKAGMEKELRKKETSRRKKVGIAPPTAEELEAIGISDETAEQLLAIFDRNSDGVLQLEEFKKTSIITQSLELLIQQQREELRLARLAESEAKSAAKQVEGMLPVLNDDPPTVFDRVLSVIPYLLPLMDSLFYGGHIINQNPLFVDLATPVLYLSALYRSIPFSGLGLFILFQAVAGNPKINKLVRFNLRQGINLDIALLVPSLLASIALAIPGLDPETLESVATTGGDIISIAMWSAISYSVISSFFGVIPNKLPFLGAMNRENPDREDKYAGVVPRAWRVEKEREKKGEQAEIEERKKRTKKLMEEGLDNDDETDETKKSDDSGGDGGNIR